MARMTKFCGYRRLERPYIRTSKFRKKSFVRAKPVSKIVRYVMGERSGVFQKSVLLKSLANMQVRDNALEAARQTSNRYMQKFIGKVGWRMVLRPYPHHMLRNNPLAAGAGADRMSTGMKHSFGKVIGIAAQIRLQQPVFQIDVPLNQVVNAKEALRRASNKLPFKCSTEVVDNKVYLRDHPKK